LDSQTAPPTVSVITATYNRSNVLAPAVESVRRQTFRDWELWVVGDACTDDTEQVVASFKDPRVRFFNLAVNVGEQSGPNNEGCRRARGRFIAYLNHDDLWLPDHLETALGAINETGADLVYTQVDVVLPGGTNYLGGVAPRGRHRPGGLVVASSWLMRRELVEEIGPWRFYRECRNIPSQDWLFRVWKAGRQIRPVPRMTVVAFHTVWRPGVYARREAHENLHYFERMCREPDFRERELASMPTAPPRPWWQRWRPLSTLPTRAAHKAVYAAALALGRDPYAALCFLRGERKGESIDRLRRLRGLGEIGRR
jgi:glycosyltransferase involved in cell wall biosynthesis